MSVRSKTFNYLSTLPISELEEEPIKQGIVTILTSDFENTKVSSLRRTLSADMSSQKWLAQNGLFSPVKKIESFDEYSSSSSSEEEEHEINQEPNDFWSSILSQKERKETQEPELEDVWDSILAQKSEKCSNVPQIYVHPLEKKSTVRLSDKSLEMCTECIGSENGSDGFCSEIPNDVCEDKIKDLHVIKPKYSKALPFPPPLPSFSHMQSHRRNGRLILEAVQIPSRNCFHTDRRNGRLLLTLINNYSSQESAKDFEEIEEKQDDQWIDDDADDGGQEAVAEEGVAGDEFVIGNLGKGMQFVAEHGSISLPSGILSMHKSGLTISLSRKNLNLIEAEDAEGLPIPPPPPVARMIPSPPTVSFNANEYFLRSKATVNMTPQTLRRKNSHNNCEANGAEHGDLVPISGNKQEYFVPYLKGCKELRRSLLIWEPYCIATS